MLNKNVIWARSIIHDLQRLRIACSCKRKKMSSREEAPVSQHSLTGQDSEAAGHRHPRKGHRRSIMHANVAESMKMKQVLYCCYTVAAASYSFFQARIKALREQQRSKIDSRHKYIISLVALHVGLSDAEVEDNLLDGSQVIIYTQNSVS